MQELLREIIKQFRLGAEGRGNTLLVQFIEQIMQIVQRQGQLNPEVMPVMQEILAAQERADYLWIADMMEYKLIQIT